MYGADHQRTLAARRQLERFKRDADVSAPLADWQGVLGSAQPSTPRAQQPVDPARARDRLAALLPNRQRELGPDHPDTLTTRLRLGTYTALAGHPAAARDQLATLLPDIERVLGADHPDTLTTRGELALYTGRAGDPAAARDQLIELLPDVNRLRGPDHPDALVVRLRLAINTSQGGIRLQRATSSPPCFPTPSGCSGQGPVHAGEAQSGGSLNTPAGHNSRVCAGSGDL